VRDLAEGGDDVHELQMFDGAGSSALRYLPTGSRNAWRFREPGTHANGPATERGLGRHRSALPPADEVVGQAL